MPKLNVIACLTLTTSLLAGLCHASELPMDVRKEEAFCTTKQHAPMTYLLNPDIWQPVLTALDPTTRSELCWHDTLSDAYPQEVEDLGRLSSTCRHLKALSTPLLALTHKHHTEVIRMGLTLDNSEMPSVPHNVLTVNHVFSDTLFSYRIPKFLKDQGATPDNILHVVFQCEKMIQLPPLSFLPHLQTISLSYCNSLKPFGALRVTSASPVSLSVQGEEGVAFIRQNLSFLSLQEMVKDAHYKTDSEEESVYFFKGASAPTLEEATTLYHKNEALRQRLKRLEHQTVPGSLPHEHWRKTLSTFAPDLNRKGETRWTRLRREYYENLKDLHTLCLTSQFFYDEVAPFLAQEKELMPLLTNLPLETDARGKVTGLSVCSRTISSQLHYAFRFQKERARQVRTLQIEDSFLTRFPDLYLLSNLEEVILKNVTSFPSYEKLRARRHLVFTLSPKKKWFQDLDKELRAFSHNPNVFYIKHIKKNGDVRYLAATSLAELSFSTGPSSSIYKILLGALLLGGCPPSHLALPTSKR